MVAYHHQQLLTAQEEKSVVCFCKTLDEDGHPVNLHILKEFAISRLPVFKCWEVGKNCTIYIPNCHPELAARFSHCLDCQRAHAHYSATMKHIVPKVIILN